MQWPMRWTISGLVIALSGWMAAGAHAQAPSGGAAPQAAANTLQPDKAKAYYHYSLGHLYQERGALFNRPELLSQAIDQLELALQYDPSSTFLSMELADLYAATGRWQNALDQMEQNVRRNPNDRAARRLLGELYVRLFAGSRSAQMPEDFRRRAVQEFESIVQRDPNDVASYLVLAQLYRASDESMKAEETLKKALALQPDSPDASTQLALLYMDLGDYRSAIDLLQKLVAKDDDPELLGTLAYAYEQLHDYRSAASTYNRALQRDPDNQRYRKSLGENLLYSRQYDQAREEYEGVLRTNPADAEAYLRLSQLYRAQGKYDLARENLGKAEELAPENLEIGYNLVLLDEMEGKTQDALNRIQKVLQETAKNGANSYTAQEKTNRAIFLEKLGSLQRDLGNFEGAQEAFQQMAALGGDNGPRGRVRLIETFQESRQYDKALQESQAALREYPDNREVVLARASLLASTGDAGGAVQLVKPLLRDNREDRELWIAMAQIHLRARQFDEAFKAAEQASEYSASDDDRAYIFFLNGSIWERQKKFDKAEEQFRKALEINPDSAMTLNYLGYMFADQGVRLDEATQLIQRALETEPTNGAYLDSLGWAYFRQNRLDLAEEYLKKAAERIPNDPTIRDHLGDVYAKAGRTALAVSEWKAALEQWRRLPKNEVEPEEVSSIERKLRDAGAR
jgi:tetratricopeptide (TPR) repeat protein